MEHHHDDCVAVDGAVDERLEARLRDALAQRREEAREAHGGGEGKLEGDEGEHDEQHAEALVAAQGAVGLTPLSEEAQVEDTCEGARHLLESLRELDIGHRHDERRVDLGEASEWASEWASE